MKSTGVFRQIKPVVLPVAVAGLLACAAQARAQGNMTLDWIAATNRTATNYFLGKVGVGTNAPASTLHVNGDLRVDGQIRQKCGSGENIVLVGSDYPPNTNGSSMVTLVGWAAGYQATNYAGSMFLGATAGTRSTNCAQSVFSGN